MDRFHSQVFPICPSRRNNTILRTLLVLVLLGFWLLLEFAGGIRVCFCQVLLWQYLGSLLFVFENPKNHHGQFARIKLEAENRLGEIFLLFFGLP